MTQDALVPHPLLVEVRKAVGPMIFHRNLATEIPRRRSAPSTGPGRPEVRSSTLENRLRQSPCRDEGSDLTTFRVNGERNRESTREGGL